ncbi:MAG: DUF2304 domain-containing protein [Rhodocyclaceae bacterium]|nr:DUF2304 domain-containing protein [Rhodocyclaceae bacterium]
MNYQIFSALLGTALGVVILLLVRRDHLQLGHAMFWLVLAAGSVIFGLAPALSDRIATAFGISYGPTLVILIALAALIVKGLQADMLTSRLERNIRRLNQRIALVEAEMRNDAPARSATHLRRVDY